MERLRSRDLSAAVQFLATCDAAAGVQAFATSVTAGLPALIRCDVAVFGMANPRVGILHAVENPRVTSATDLETYLRAGRRGGNPPLDHFARTSDVEARLLSDFATRRQFHALPIYSDFYRPLRMEFVLAACINNSPTAFDGISLNRTGPDFTGRDRALLTLLRTHIVAGYRTAMAVDRLRADLAVAASAHETPGVGLIVLSEGGPRMHFVSPGAAELLSRYFGARRQSNELPDLLDRWIRHHIDTTRDASRVPPVQKPLVIDHHSQRLVVRGASVARDTLLMLEEPAVRADWLRIAPLGVGPRDAYRLITRGRDEVAATSAAASPDLPIAPPAWRHDDPSRPQPSIRLTPHEIRLLGLLADGHTNKTAAALLGSSVHTVAFHLKNIFQKLQVHSKSEAVAKALRNRIVR